VLERLTHAALSRLSDERLAEIESTVRWHRGQGWGTATVAAEVAAALELAGEGVKVVADVGANKGAWAREALRIFPHAHIHAFEPSRTTFEELACALGAEPRVSLYRVGLSSTEGSATLYSDQSASGLASLTRRRLDHFGIELDMEETVHVTTLAHWLEAENIPHVDVLKLDVEGHELDVLRGAEGRLDRVRVLQFEFGGCNIDTRTYLQDFWYLLTDAGFRLHRLGPRGLTKIEQYREGDEVFATTNYFAARSD